MNAARPDVEFWRSRYREGNIPWDLGEPSAPVRELIERYFPNSAKVLIPGCGRGHEALYLAERGYEVTAVDLVAEPLDYLRREAGKRKVDIEIRQTNIFELSQDFDGAFDIFLEQTCLCALDPGSRSDYEALAHRMLKSGGKFMGVFMEVPWEGGPPFSCPPNLVQALFGPARWDKAGLEPVHPRNPARPGSEYTLRLIKRPSS